MGNSAKCMGLSQAVCISNLSGLSPLHGGRKSYCCHNHQLSKTTSCVPQPALSTCHQPHTLLVPPTERMPAGVRERVISKQLRVGHIYLSLGAGPFLQPLLPLQMCLLLELLPPNAQISWELSLKERRKKKPVPRDGHLQGAGD